MNNICRFCNKMMIKSSFTSWHDCKLCRYTKTNEMNAKYQNVERFSFYIDDNHYVLHMNYDNNHSMILKGAISGNVGEIYSENPILTLPLLLQINPQNVEEKCKTLMSFS